MSRQNLKVREIAIALDELEGKVSILEAANHLESLGFLTPPEDLHLHWKLEEARKAMQASRRFRSKTDEVQLEWVHFTEVLEDGTKADYYRKYGEVTLEEGVQISTYWNDHGRYGFRQRDRYLAPLVKRFGRAAVQAALPFDLPMLVHA